MNISNLSTYSPKITVIICTLNEAKNLSHVMPNIPNWVYEIILVDGHSTDTTVSVARQICPAIKVVYQTGKGKGDALKCGFKNASGDIIITLDADGATDPREMNKFVSVLLDGFDFVKGSRFLLKLPVNKATHRTFGNLLIAAVFDILYFETFTDMCSGYNAFWRNALERFDFTSGDSFEDEPLLITRVKKSGLRMAEVGHHDLGRIYGESKSPSWRQGLKAIKTIIRERFSN